MTSLNVLVVDDEKIARRRVARLVKETREAVVLAECGGGREAVAAIREHHPDLVFLDVQMPDLDGFQVIESVGPAHMPAVVFVTAFDEFALRAFDLHAVDYLLKPYDTERFRIAFDRAKQRLVGDARAAADDRFRALLDDYLKGQQERESINGQASQSGAGGSMERFAIHADGRMRNLRTVDVDWWETEGNYVRAHIGAASHLIRMTAARLEAQLDPKQFVRIHRRYVVNLDRVVEVQPWFSGDAVAILRSGAKLRVSRLYRQQFHDRLLGSVG